jgi:hypothetical protein
MVMETVQRTGLQHCLRMCHAQADAPRQTRSMSGTSYFALAAWMHSGGTLPVLRIRNLDRNTLCWTAIHTEMYYIVWEYDSYDPHTVMPRSSYTSDRFNTAGDFGWVWKLSRRYWVRGGTKGD